MSKTVIIYKTKYNNTKKYAGWLAIKINADLYEISDIKSSDLKNYDTIIFGASIENGYIRGVEFIKDNSILCRTWTLFTRWDYDVQFLAYIFI